MLSHLYLFTYRCYLTGPAIWVCEPLYRGFKTQLTIKNLHQTTVFIDKSKGCNLIFIATTDSVYRMPGTALSTLHVLSHSHFLWEEMEAQGPELIGRMGFKPGSNDSMQPSSSSGRENTWISFKICLRASLITKESPCADGNQAHQDTHLGQDGILTQTKVSSRPRLFVYYLLEKYRCEEKRLFKSDQKIHSKMERPIKPEDPVSVSYKKCWHHCVRNSNATQRA